MWKNLRGMPYPPEKASMRLALILYDGKQFSNAYLYWAFLFPSLPGPSSLAPVIAFQINCLPMSLYFRSCIWEESRLNSELSKMPWFQGSPPHLKTFQELLNGLVLMAKFFLCLTRVWRICFLSDSPVPFSSPFHFPPQPHWPSYKCPFLSEISFSSGFSGDGLSWSSFLTALLRDDSSLFLTSKLKHHFLRDLPYLWIRYHSPLCILQA